VYCQNELINLYPSLYSVLSHNWKYIYNNYDENDALLAVYIEKIGPPKDDSYIKRELFVTIILYSGQLIASENLWWIDKDGRDNAVRTIYIDDGVDGSLDSIQVYHVIYVKDSDGAVANVKLICNTAITEDNDRKLHMDIVEEVSEWNSSEHI